MIFPFLPHLNALIYIWVIAKIQFSILVCLKYKGGGILARCEK